jgi:dsDNA-specific endonuclease/ATPase MutS2
MNNTKAIVVLHGKGDGILRQAVVKKMKEYKDISNIRHPKEGDGGNGITMADMI